jgi:hypothetical protein
MLSLRQTIIIVSIALLVKEKNASNPQGVIGTRTKRNMQKNTKKKCKTLNIGRNVDLQASNVELIIL